MPVARKPKLLRNGRIWVTAPKEHQALTGEPDINKTNIKFCSGCHHFLPHYRFRPMPRRSLDGLDGQCRSCRAAQAEKRAMNRTDAQDRAYEDKQNEYYWDNPQYYRLRTKANRLRKQANKAIQDSLDEEERHKALFPGAPFHSSSRMFAVAELRLARKLVAQAGTPTGMHVTKPVHLAGVLTNSVSTARKVQRNKSTKPI